MRVADRLESAVLQLEALRVLLQVLLEISQLAARRFLHRFDALLRGRDLTRPGQYRLVQRLETVRLRLEGAQ